MVAKLDAELPFPHHKKLVYVLMVVPGKFALHFGQFDLLAIQSGDHLGPPTLTEQTEFLAKADLSHRQRSTWNIVSGNDDGISGKRTQKSAYFWHWRYKMLACHRTPSHMERRGAR